jgi:hypothetical protein
MSPPYYDAVLKDIQLEYPLAANWEIDSNGCLLVEQLTEELNK